MVFVILLNPINSLFIVEQISEYKKLFKNTLQKEIENERNPNLGFLSFSMYFKMSLFQMCTLGNN